MNAVTPIEDRLSVPATGIQCLGLPALDIERGRISVTIREGSTVAEIVSALFPDLSDARRGMVRVTVGEWVIHQHTWLSVRPKPGIPVIARIVPQGGSLRNVLSIVVSIAAVAAGQFYAPAFLVGAVGQTAASAITTAAVAFAGTMLLNALIPIKPPEKEEERYNITGWKNQLVPGAPFASVLGRLRIAPNFAAYPYTESVGDDRYITALFAMRGSVEVSGYRLGYTSIEEDLGEYDELSDFVVVEVKYPGDGPSTLYPMQVIEDMVGQELVNRADETPGVPVKRSSAADAEELSIDLHFPGGLFDTDKEGDDKAAKVDVLIEYRLAGTEPWVTAISLSIDLKEKKPFFRTYRWQPAVRGRYEVRLTRTNNANEDRGSDRVDWLCIRSHRPEAPLNVTTDLTAISVRAKASRLTNGTLDAFNFIAEGVSPDWDAPTQTWITRKTRNPASHYRRAHQSNENRMPKADAKLYLEQIQRWHEMCVAKGLTYDRLHDYKARFDEVLDDICRAGRATKQNAGSQWGVCIDQPRTAVVAHIGARNSWDFSGTSPKLDLPDAFSVKFNDETNDYEPAERVIPRPGFVGLPVTIEALGQEGMTNPSAIWRFATRRFLELIHRRESWSCQQDVEALTTMRGDLVRLAYFREQVSGRVTAIVGDMVILDEETTMVGGQSYVCRFRPDEVDEENDSSRTILRSVIYRAGTLNSFRLSGSGAMPKVGNLAFFGTEGAETEEAIVKDVEMGEEMTARLTLVPHAPQIDTILDAMTVPVWDGRVGYEAEDSTVAPAVPRIIRIDSGIRAQESGTTGYPGVRVYVSPGSVSPSVGSYQVRHRLQGNVTWTTLTVLASQASVKILGYSKGQVIEVMAMAIGRGVSPLSSAFSAISTHTVGANDPVSIAAPTQQLAVIEGSSVRVSWKNPNDPTFQSAKVYRYRDDKVFANAVLISEPLYGAAGATPSILDTPGQGSWIYAIVADDDTVFRTSSPAITSAVALLGAEIIVNGGFDTDTVWSKQAGWTIGSGVASHTGAGASLYQAVSVVAGQTYRVAYTVTSYASTGLSVYLGGGTTVSGAGATAPGSYVHYIVAAAGNTIFGFGCSGDVSLDNVSLRLAS
jgi:hypothetical protein